MYIFITKIASLCFRRPLSTPWSLMDKLLWWMDVPYTQYTFSLQPPESKIKVCVRARVCV